MGEFKRYTDEQIEQAKNADLADFVRSHGFICKNVGKEIHVEGYGGLYINPQKNLFTVFSQSKSDGSPDGGKGPLAFCQKVMGMSFMEAMQTIVGDAAEVKQFTPKSEAAPKEKREFIMPEKSDNCKKVYAYLINQRRLDPKIISDFVKQGVLYQGFTEFTKKDGTKSKHENAIFLHINENGEPCGADVQGVYSEARFKGIIPPNETDKGFVYVKGNPEKTDTVYLFEAPIDLMSFVELHPEIENAKFVAMGGLKPTIAEHYIDSGLNIVSCVDNDKAGQAFNNRILKEKMQDSLSMAGGTDLDKRTYPDREPPIEYIIAELNGKQCSFFLSSEDFKDARNAKAEIAQSSFIWANRSNFQVNRECAEAGVKDFNDLLKLTKSGDFAKEVSKVADWSEKAQIKAQERLQERSVEKSK
ncbi:MAG: DUF3991 domain-containing protein [Oscillospiraceae bacterium]